MPDELLQALNGWMDEMTSTHVRPNISKNETLISLTCFAKNIENWVLKCTICIQNKIPSVDLNSQRKFGAVSISFLILRMPHKSLPYQNKTNQWRLGENH